MKIKQIFALCSILLTSVFCTATAFANETSNTAFNDVNRDTKVGQAIYKMYECGYLSGYPDGSFRPDSTITRAELTRVFNQVFKYDLNEEYASTMENFKDNTDEEAWYYNDVRIAQSNGYINGFEDRTFRPAENFTRQQTCVVTALVAGLLPTDEDVTINDEVSEWAEAYVKMNIQNGVFDLEQNNNFRAKQNITRGEVCEALARFIVIDVVPVTDENGEIVTNEEGETETETRVSTRTSSGGGGGGSSSSRSLQTNTSSNNNSGSTGNTVNNNVENASSTVTEKSSEGTTKSENSSQVTSNVVSKSETSTDRTTESSTENTTESSNSNKGTDTNKSSSTNSGSGTDSSKDNNKNSNNNQTTSSITLSDEERAALSRVIDVTKYKVLPEITNSEEKAVAQLILSSMQSYYNDSSYDIVSDISTAKAMASALDSDKKEHLKTLIYSQYSISDISVLQNIFSAFL